MVVFWIILGFGLTIFVHELGHFLAARAVGVRVITFSIGIGPRLVRVYTDKHGTDFILAAFPLGGYVEMLGQQDMPKLRQDASRADYESDHYLSKTPLQRLFVIVAGVVMNLLFAYLLIAVSFGIGIPFTANKVGGFLPGSQAPKAGLVPGDTITKINQKDVNTWEDVITQVALIKDHSKPVHLTVVGVVDGREGKEGTKKLVVPLMETGNQALPKSLGVFPYQPAIVGASIDKAAATPAKNPSQYKGMEVLAASLVGDGSIRRTTPEGIAQLVASNPSKSVLLELKDKNNEVHEVEVAVPSKKIFASNFLMTKAMVEVMEGSPADAAGLLTGDEIVAINDEPVFGWQSIPSIMGRLNKPQQVSVQVKRNEETLRLRLKPQWDPHTERYVLGVFRSIEHPKSQQISYVSKSLAQLGNGPKIGDQLVDAVERNNNIEITVLRGEQQKTLSVSKLLLPETTIGDLVYRRAESKLVKHAFPGVLAKAVPQTARELGEVITFLKRLLTGKMSIKMLGGPVRIFEVSYFVGETKGLAYFILLFAKIGISLAVLNLLPIPALDGGNAVLTLIELVSRRPLKQTVVNGVNMVGILILLCLFIFVFYNDISNLLNR